MMRSGYTNLSESQKLMRVTDHGWMIEYMDDPSEELQLAAVNESCVAFRHIKNPTHKVINLHEVLYVL